MSFIGTKQTVAGSVTISTSAGQVIGYISGCAGAKGILLRVSGGSNAANSLVAATLKAVADTALGATAATTAALTLALVAGALGKTNGTVSTAPLYYFALGCVDAISGATGFLPIPTPVVQVVLQMVTAASTGCVVEAWPVYDFDPRGGGVSATLDT